MQIYYTPEELEEFWSKVSITEHCWTWTGATRKKGYGRSRAGNKEVSAHRFAWVMFNGQIPDGLFVCHKCDVPSCVRISHLFLGTAADNRHDQDAKMRHNHGEAVNSNKLSESQVLEIRRVYDEGINRNQSSLARQFGVHQTLISLIVRREKWRHLK